MTQIHVVSEITTSLSLLLMTFFVVKGAKKEKDKLGNEVR